MRRLLIILPALLLAGCGLFKKDKGTSSYPLVTYEDIQSKAGGLHPPDHVALAKWDERFYYFEWRKIVVPATMRTVEGSGRVSVSEFDKKNGQPLERKVGIVGKEDLNGQLYNAGAF